MLGSNKIFADKTQSLSDLLNKTLKNIAEIANIRN